MHILRPSHQTPLNLWIVRPHWLIMPDMRWRLQWCLFVILACVLTPAWAAPHTRPSLLLENTQAKPGQTILAGLRLVMEPGWHTYWRNGGDAGAPTHVEWTLPPGIAAGEILWPVPEKLIDSDLTTYIYHDEVVLLVPLTLATNVTGPEMEIRGKISWLECKKTCIPAEGIVVAKLQIGAASLASQDTPILNTWRARLPQRDADLHLDASWTTGADPDTRLLNIEWQTNTLPVTADFFPYESEVYKATGLSTQPTNETERVRLQRQVQKTGAQWPERIMGLMVYAKTNGAPNVGVEVELHPAPPANQALTTATDTNIVPPQNQKPLLMWLLYAFIGGLILNIMPCVLPVIALKVLGFVNQSKENPGRVRLLGLVYGAGVLVSFLALALMVLAVKATGHLAGWGMQFGNPMFVVGLTVLVTLIALNLFGVFEVVMSFRVTQAASGLAGREGAAGAFFNGVLATVLATPCTAPFLGAALGFAFTQQATIIIAIFLTVGAGLAAPYVLLSWHPALLRWMPKPGAWMEKFKVAMGFPMLATAIWLFQLAPIFYGRRFWWLGIFLVMIAVAAWVFGEFVQRGRSRKGLAITVVAVLLLVGYATVLEGQLHWRLPVTQQAGGSLQESPGGIAWQRWTPEAVVQARSQGRPVFVDFTAEWCATCQVNKKVSIEIPSVRARLKEIGAVTLLADYTTVPPEVTKELNRFGRAGVPMVLVYPKRADLPPEVLPELLTPGMVLNALNRAVQSPP
jgi:thiol:disulfide interchange protein